MSPLTEARQVRGLSPGEADQHHPVRLRGVVTCSDFRAMLCFIQDETAGIYLYNPDQPLKAGQFVEVIGFTGSGRYSPIVQVQTVKVLGVAEMPVARNVSIDQLATGSEDSQWIELQGIVHAQTNDWDNLVLDIVAGANRLKVRILDYDRGREPELIDAKVRVRGVVGAHSNNKKQLTGFHLLVPDISHLTVMEPAPVESFTGPVMLGQDLMSYPHPGTAGHRVHVQGVVTMQWLGRSLFIRDKAGGIQVQTKQITTVKVGDLVDVVGFPTRAGYTPLLRDSVFRKISSASIPQPSPTTPTHALAGNFDNELIQLEAQLLKVEDSHLGHEWLLLQGEKQIFKAYFRNYDFQGEQSTVLEGSSLRLTGICTVEVDDNQTPEAFSLWLRSPKDVVVVKRPPWWTLKQFKWLMGVSGAAVLFGFVWLGMLRRQVQERTQVVQRHEAILEERCRDLFENANDIIYSHDLAGNLTSFNRAGEQILGYGRSEALGMNIAKVVAPVHMHLITEKLEEKLAGAPRTSYELEVIGKDGRHRFLEVNSRLIYQDAKPVGVQGIARDISGRMESERELRQREQQLQKSLEERERLGQDLHDGIIQSIYAVGLNLEDCRRMLDEEPQRAKERLANGLVDLNTVIRDVRNFIVGLEPEILKGRELKTALKSLVLTMNESGSARFVLKIDPLAADALDSQAATQLLHIAREAMSNSLKHSQAETVMISLRENSGSIRLEIRDDGIGFDPKKPNSNGQGLQNIFARAQTLQGKLMIISQPGAGARVVLDVPRKEAYGSI